MLWMVEDCAVGQDGRVAELSLLCSEDGKGELQLLRSWRPGSNRPGAIGSLISH